MPDASFREQALQARHASALGRVHLPQPLRGWWLSAAAVLIAASLVTFLCLASYTRRSTVVGQLVPIQGVITVTAPAAGVVSWLDVAEGAWVGTQGTLALVSMPRATVDAGDTRSATVQQLRRRQDSLEREHRALHAQLQVRGHGLADQLAAAREELRQLEAGVRTRRQQVRLAAETLQRLQQPQSRQYVSELQVTQQEATLLEYTGRMQGLEQQASAARRLIAQLRQAMDELPAQLQAKDAAHAHAMTRLAQERLQADASGALMVRAPVAGMVATRLVKPGQAVQAGQPLLILLPGDGRLEAELWVPSRVIGFLAPGDDVRLRYHAFPYQKFGHQRGTVERISRTAIEGNLQPALAKDGGGATFYRITVRLLRQDVIAYGLREPLKPGMAVSADVMGERRRLIEWMFEPLYALAGRVTDAA